MSLWIGAVTLGLIYAFLAWAVFLSLRVLRFADISVDGTLVTGAGVTCMLIIAKVHPALATAAACGAGMLGGALTGVIHTKLKVNDLLAGILVMTAAYSINLRIMGGSNVALLDQPTLLSLPPSSGQSVPDQWEPLIALAALAIIFRLLVACFLRTDLGMALRATGDNEAMITAQGVNTNSAKILMLALSNGLAALSGALLAQYQGFTDVSMGIGSLVAGIASVILGETLLGSRSIGWLVTAALLGSLGFRLIVALAMKVGIDPNDLKLFTAAFVLIALAVPGVRAKLIRKPAGGVA